MKHWRLLLILVAVACFGVALSYPIRYRLAEQSNNSELENLSAMRHRVLSEMGEDNRGTDATASDDSEAVAPARTADESTQETASPKETTSLEDIRAQAFGLATQEPEPTQSLDALRTQAFGLAGQTAGDTPTPAPTDTPEPTAPPEDEASRGPTPTPGLMDLILDYIPNFTPTPSPTPSPRPKATPVPTPTIDRFERTSALAYTAKKKVELDPDRILPELQEIYALNNDLVGWIEIPGSVIDYPVVQTNDQDFYLNHDFYGNSNQNGQIILDVKCDPYTPSYNLIISGHRMNNGSMFAGLASYKDKRYWEEHKYVHFDSLMSRGNYIVFAAFYSADYDEDEKGFRYNADVRYRLEADQWLEEIRENQIYDTNIDVAFGDEFITLTTCNYQRRNGRFVLVCRKLREGEKEE